MLSGLPARTLPVFLPSFYDSTHSYPPPHRYQSAPPRRFLSIFSPKSPYVVSSFLFSTFQALWPRVSIPLLRSSLLTHSESLVLHQSSVTSVTWLIPPSLSPVAAFMSLLKLFRRLLCLHSQPAASSSKLGTV